MIGVLVLVVLGWGAFADRVNDPCRGLSPLACVEHQRQRAGDLVAPGAVYAPAGAVLELHPYVVRARGESPRELQSSALWGEP